MDQHRCSTDYEKALFLHDYICEHCTYDYRVVIDEITGTANQNYIAYHMSHHFCPNEAFDLHGCLLRGIAVCAGISEAYKVLLYKAGIECKYVRANEHIWNVVKMVLQKTDR